MNEELKMELVSIVKATKQTGMKAIEVAGGKWDVYVVGLSDLWGLSYPVSGGFERYDEQFEQEK